MLTRPRAAVDHNGGPVVGQSSRRGRYAEDVLVMGKTIDN